MFFISRSLSCASHSIGICTVLVNNVRNMYAVSTNQTTDFLNFSNKVIYET